MRPGELLRVTARWWQSPSSGLVTPPSDIENPRILLIPFHPLSVMGAATFYVCFNKMCPLNMKKKKVFP